MSDIIFSTSYVVFSTSDIIFGVFRKECAIMVLRHLYGRIAYTLCATARTVPQTAATTLQIRANLGVCNTPLRRCNLLANCSLCVCAAYCLHLVHHCMNRAANYRCNIAKAPHPSRGTAHIYQGLCILQRHCHATGIVFGVCGQIYIKQFAIFEFLYLVGVAQNALAVFVA